MLMEIGGHGGGKPFEETLRRTPAAQGDRGMRGPPRLWAIAHSRTRTHA